MESAVRSDAKRAGERRSARRVPVQMFLNKYVDGVPHLCEAIELSMTGMLVRNVLGPDTERACYALEIERAAGADRIWLCATGVWKSGPFEALTFVGPTHLDRLKLADLLDDLRAS